MFLCSTLVDNFYYYNCALQFFCGWHPYKRIQEFRINWSSFSEEATDEDILKPMER